jgi:glycerate kinase
VLAGEDEQGAQQDRRLAGVEAEAGEDPPVPEVAEAVPGGGAGGGQGLACRALADCRITSGEGC